MLHGSLAPKSGNIVRNKLDSTELSFVQDIVGHRGGNFVGPPKKNYPGIDGWLDGTPVQLKQMTGNSPTAVSKYVRRAGEKATNAGYSGVDVFIQAPNVSKEAVMSGPINNIINQQSSLSTVYILTKDGWVIIK